MLDAIPTPKPNRSLKAPLSLVGVLLAATLLAGVLINRAASVRTDGSIQLAQASNGTVSLAFRTSQGAVLVGSDGLVQVELVLSAEERKRDRASSLPTDLVVVLDRSGSMAGDKIDYARAAVLELIQQLGAQDRFALVTYSTDAELRIPLRPATAVAVTLQPGEGVEVLEAAGYPLERHGRRVVFHPGTLFSGQERRLWVTYRIPSDEPGEYELGGIDVTYKDRGRRYRLGLEDVPKIACVSNEETFFASVDKEAWKTPWWANTTTVCKSRSPRTCAKVVSKPRRPRSIPTVSAKAD